MWKTQISNEEFSRALIEAIGKSRVFTKVVQGSDGDYLLSVTLFSLEQPSIGAAFTVNMEAGWILTRLRDNTILWREAIKSSYTADFGEAFVAARRLRLATEGAARNNIAAGLSRISKLPL